jgi:transposase
VPRFTQEEFMDVPGMRSQGWTIAEVTRETNYHRATVSKWLKEGGAPPARTTDPTVLVVDEWWSSRIAELIEPPSRRLATSVFEIISAEGFSGSYPRVVCKVRELR